MALKRIGGTAFLKVDGVQVSLRGTLTIMPSNVTREGIAGMDGVHGFKETPRVPSIEIQISKTPEIKLTTLAGWTGKTVTADCADGTTFVLNDAFVSGDVSLDGNEGAVTVKFEGASCREI
jgi:hypothetical protein